MLFDNERGRASLPTAQALILMYLYCSDTGADRAGVIFRLSASEMLRRLRGKSTLFDQMTLSRVSWGTFCWST